VPRSLPSSISPIMRLTMLLPIPEIPAETPTKAQGLVRASGQVCRFLSAIAQRMSAAVDL
jgi:hypothetical protein